LKVHDHGKALARLGFPVEGIVGSASLSKELSARLSCRRNCRLDLPGPRLARPSPPAVETDRGDLHSGQSPAFCRPLKSEPASGLRRRHLHGHGSKPSLFSNDSGVPSSEHDDGIARSTSDGVHHHNLVHRCPGGDGGLLDSYLAFQVPSRARRQRGGPRGRGRGSEPGPIRALGNAPQTAVLAFFPLPHSSTSCKPKSRSDRHADAPNALPSQNGTLESPSAPKEAPWLGDSRCGSAVSRRRHGVSCWPCLTHPRRGLSRDKPLSTSSLAGNRRPSTRYASGDGARRCKGPRKANGVDG
jgi:hypothetical protein